ncbi:hypothetical protein Hypma_005635 [Hypsizygus marmoreus]|uniref:F-box domain-containing protein n=1 Tax=Hypsizygus marmoreus TaxID=39966 RepID=A0A369K1B7_HYPMA|nr:hypothetical protein Hypma_005635 [Hypsizygus marmoreus]
MLWYSITTPNDLQRLLALLNPIVTVYDEHILDSEQRVFAAYPQAIDWERFEKYSHLVHTIEITNLDDFDNLLATVAEARPTMNLFPNLHTVNFSLDKYRDIRHCALFMLPNVTRFTLNLPRMHDLTKVPEVNFIVGAIPRMSQLVYLEFTGEEVTQNSILDNIFVVVPKLVNVRTLIFPRYSLTARMIEACSSLPHLVELRTREASPKDYILGTELAEGGFEPNLTVNSFPSLRTLTVSTDEDSASRFLQHRNFPRHLKRLNLEIGLLTTEKVSSLLGVVASRFPTIVEVSVFQRDLVSYLIRGIEPAIRIHAVRALEPIISLPNLTGIELRNHSILGLTMGGLENLASRLPQIETLILNDSPYGVVNNPPPLSLDILITLARHCPRLRRLGLCVNARDAQMLLGYDPIELTNLQHLALGRSPIRDLDIESVALFLAQVCPPGCVLTAIQVQPSISSPWDDVIGITPILTRMRVIQENKMKETLRLFAGAR